MSGLTGKIKLVAVLAVIAGLVVIGILNLRDRLGSNPIASDGVYWVNANGGVQAKRISKDSPLALDLKPGDTLRYIYYNRKYEKVTRSETVYLYLSRIGVGGRATYVVEHSDPTLQGIYGLHKPLYDYEFVTGEANQRLPLGLYLALIGVVYLAIGLFVLFKQARARFTYLFLAWFVASFVVYFYSSIQDFSRPLDKLVDFLDIGALCLMAPLFFHFSATFSLRIRSKAKGSALFGLAYLPAAGLLVLEAIYHYFPTVFAPGKLEMARNSLDLAELAQLALYFAVGSAILVVSFVKAKTPLHRQQLKWIVWGLGLSIVPLVGFYVVPFLLDLDITPAMQAAAFGPLILVPLSFGYSIVRYRLMDVDVIMRRSFVHLVAITALGAFYMALLLAVGDLVKFVWPTADLNSWGGKAIVVAGMLIVAMLFSPIKNKLQVWADRWFYGERYTMRTGIQDFGRMLAHTTALPNLLDAIAGRLADLLSVRRVAIFVVDDGSPSGFRMAHSLGIDREIVLPVNVKEALRIRSLGRGFISQEDLTSGRASEFEDAGLNGDREWNDAPDSEAPAGTGAGNILGRVSDLHYYVPCVVRDRTVAIIGLGRTADGALLTSEDTDLLRALSGYVAVAIDNSLLYRSEMEKAQALARLKEFSENIIESVSVGIVVVDLSGRITTWNSSVQEMFSFTLDEAVGSAADSVLDYGLIDAVHRASGCEDWAIDSPRHVYKCAVTRRDGKQLTVNVSVAPFESAPGVLSGAILVIENVTERVLLEQQLMEREKLSSIGLLAAGVAHEVNTPLAGISSYSQMLLQQVPQEDPRYQLLQKIQTQTVRASGIVNNLLNFSRTGNTRFSEVDVNQVLEDTLQLLEPQLRHSQVEVVRTFGNQLTGGWGNASKLQQVFMNLILNARDAMPAGGKLVIQTRQVESSLVVDFKDTGIGIAPQDIARIYDPFFTTKGVGQGTGLGLALSYGIIQEHGGRIFVESRQGEGAHFTIKLPTAHSRQMQVASD